MQIRVLFGLATIVGQIRPTVGIGLDRQDSQQNGALGLQQRNPAEQVVDAAATPPPETCDIDSCLSAVISNKNLENPSPGCTSFFRTTVYPPVVTQTHTTHVSEPLPPSLKTTRTQYVTIHPTETVSRDVTRTTYTTTHETATVTKAVTRTRSVTVHPTITITSDVTRTTEKTVHPTVTVTKDLTRTTHTQAHTTEHLTKQTTRTTTVTSHPTITITKDVTRTTRSVTTEQLTRTADETQTSTDHTTVTNTLTETDTVTETERTVTETDTVSTTSTVDITVTATRTIIPRGLAPMVTELPRQSCRTDQISSTVPSYLSGLCTNTVKYSSACSCISAPHLTVSASSCTTVVTVTETVSFQRPTHTIITATVTKPKTVSEAHTHEETVVKTIARTQRTTETQYVTHVATSTKTDDKTHTHVVTGVATIPVTDRQTQTIVVTAVRTLTQTLRETITNQATAVVTVTETDHATQTHTVTAVRTATSLTTVTNTITAPDVVTVTSTDQVSTTETDTTTTTIPADTPTYVTTTITETDTLTETKTVTGAGYVTSDVPYSGTGIITAPTTIRTISPVGTVSGTYIVATPVPTLSCPKTGYLVQVAQLYSVDVTTGALSLIDSQLGDGTLINAMGYSIFNNVLYAVVNYTTPRIVAIGGDGSLEYLQQLPPQAPNIYNTGDVDEQNNFWIAVYGLTFYQISLTSPTFGQVLSSGTTAIPGGLHVYDWAYVPGGGNYLWSVAIDNSNNVLLFKFDRLSHVWTQMANYGKLIPGAGGFGAVYATSDGYLFGSENNSGQIWRFPVVAGGSAVHIANGPETSSNDGAHCILNGVS